MARPEGVCKRVGRGFMEVLLMWLSCGGGCSGMVGILVLMSVKLQCC